MINFFKNKVKEGMDISDVPIKWRLALFQDKEMQSYFTSSEEEINSIFETNKVNKILESKALLERFLETHPLLSNCHNGVEAFYNVTSDKQALMSSNYLTYTIKKSLGLEPVLEWNSTGNECEEWLEEEFLTLVLQISEYVKPFISLQQFYEVKIKECKTQEELDNIVINYELNLRGE